MLRDCTWGFESPISNLLGDGACPKRLHIGDLNSLLSTCPRDDHHHHNNNYYYYGGALSNREWNQLISSV